MSEQDVAPQQPRPPNAAVVQCGLLSHHLVAYVSTLIAVSLATLGSLAVVANLRGIPGSAAFENRSATLLTSASIAVALLIFGGAYLAYASSLRKGLLFHRRICLLSGRRIAGSSVALFAPPAMLAFAGAVGMVWARSTSAASSPADVATAIALSSLGASIVAVGILHAFDFAEVRHLLERFHAGRLIDALNSVSETQEKRLDARTKMIEQVVGKGNYRTLDDMLDREISFSGVQSVIKKMSSRLATLIDADGTYSTLRNRHGSIAVLYHPEYLPLATHIHLMKSQLRGLNMPPRRIQLLGRRWSPRGLESEYVLVHDVSDPRPERELDVLASLRRGPLGASESNDPSKDEPADSSGDPSTTQPEQRRRAGQSLPTPVLSDVYKSWRRRSLKKRATLCVSFDAALIELTIEEERQFNI